MNDENQIEKAIERALETLAEDDLRWVRRSALRERAHLIGAAAAIGELSEGSKVGHRLTLKILTQTLYARADDLPYQATELWAATEALCSELTILRREIYGASIGEEIVDFQGRIGTAHTTSGCLLRKLEELGRHWAQANSQIKDVLERISRTLNTITATKTPEREKAQGVLEELSDLERALRDNCSRICQFEMEPRRF